MMLTSFGLLRGKKMVSVGLQLHLGTGLLLCRFF